MASSGSPPYAANALLFSRTTASRRTRRACTTYSDTRSSRSLRRGIPLDQSDPAVYPAGTSSAFGDPLDPLINSVPPADRINAGATQYFMCWYRDPAGGGSFYNGSDALETALVPVILCSRASG